MRNPNTECLVHKFSHCMADNQYNSDNNAALREMLFVSYSINGRSPLGNSQLSDFQDASKLYYFKTC